MAEKLLVRDDVDDVSRIHLMYERAYGRPPSEQESARLLEFLDRYDQALQPHEANASRRQLAAWHGLCRVIVSASEFIYVD